MLAKYAPEYPCLTGGIVNAGKLQAEAFRGFTLHIVLETLPNQPRGYNAADVPVLGDKRGPSLPAPAGPAVVAGEPAAPPARLRRRREHPDRQGHLARRLPGGYAGTADEAAILKSLLGPGLGLTADDVPDLGSLLVGPMARGAEVTLGIER